MGTTAEILEIVGLMAVLSSGAVLFVTIAQRLAGRRKTKLKLGCELAVFFGLGFLFQDAVLPYTGLQIYAVEISQAFASLFWISAAFALNAAIDRFLWHGIFARQGQPIVPRLLTDFGAAFIYLAAIMIVMHFVFGRPITAIAATSGAVAFIIGYSAQATLGELFSGVALQVSGTLRKGDHIQIGGVYGWVEDIDWRSVTVVQFSTESSVIYPNSVFSGQEFINYSRPTEQIRVANTITAEFSAPPDLVVRAIEEELKTTRIILQDPAPLAYVLQTNEFGIEYRVMWYLPNDDDWYPALTEVHSAIWAAFRKHGIRPGLNHYHQREGSAFDDHAWSVRNVDWVAERRNLECCELLKSLDKETLDRFVSQAVRHEFVPPQVMSERGAPGDRLFFMIKGRAAADLPLDDGAENADGATFMANEIVAGEVFGLRAFLNRERRQEQVQCLDHAVVYEVRREIMDDLIVDHPEIEGIIRSEIAARDEEAERRRKASRIEQARRERLAHKKEIAVGVSGRLSSLMSGGLFRRGPSKDRIAEAAMAAAALVAAADGTIDASERQAVVTTFEELDLFRFIDAERGLEKFDAHCHAIRVEKERGTEVAMAAVRRLAKSPEAAELVIEIALAISAADGEIDIAEEERIDALRAAVGLTQPNQAEAAE